jgi:hypothetical protein
LSLLTLLVVLLYALLGIGSGSGSTGSGTAKEHATTHAVPAAITLTQADAATDVDIARDSGVPVQVHLSHRWRWSAPRVSGPATLQRIDSVTDPGYDAWLVEPTGKGTVSIRAVGRPGPRNLKLTIHVR